MLGVAVVEQNSSLRVIYPNSFFNVVLSASYPECSEHGNNGWCICTGRTWSKGVWTWTQSHTPSLLHHHCINTRWGLLQVCVCFYVKIKCLVEKSCVVCPFTSYDNPIPNIVPRASPTFKSLSTIARDLSNITSTYVLLTLLKYGWLLTCTSSVYIDL